MACTLLYVFRKISDYYYHHSRASQLQYFHCYIYAKYSRAILSPTLIGVFLFTCNAIRDIFGSTYTESRWTAAGASVAYGTSILITLQQQPSCSSEMYLSGRLE